MFRTISNIGQPLKYGFNAFKNKWDIGFKLKYWRNRVFAVRYSKNAKKIFVYHITSSSENAFMEWLRK